MIVVPEEPEFDTIPVSVTKVFDGDGFLANLELPGASVELAVRMGFIDAPEMAQPGGEEARDFLRKVIERQRLELAILMKMDTGKSFDRHGRVVAVPYLRTQTLSAASMPATAKSFSRNIELEMVINGWAWVLDRYGPPDAYYDALEDAQRHRRGIWARDDNLHPGRFKAMMHRSPKMKTGQADATPDLLQDVSDSRSCDAPGCDGHLVERKGKYGLFLGCSRYPACRRAHSI